MTKHWWFAALSLISGALLAISIHPIFIVLGFAIAVCLIIWDYLRKESADETRQEEPIEIKPEDWTVVIQQGMAVGAELTIPEARHGKGRHINVRIRQTEFKKWDLDEPVIQDGSIIIRYASNNFPQNPRIALRVYVSGRN